MKISASWLTAMITAFVLFASGSISADGCVPRVETLHPPVDFVKFHYKCRDDALRHALQIQCAGQLDPDVFACPEKNHIDMVASFFRWTFQKQAEIAEKSAKVAIEKVKSSGESKGRKEIRDFMSDFMSDAMDSEFHQSSDIKDRVGEFDNDFTAAGCVLVNP